jgi:cytochrome b561
MNTSMLPPERWGAVSQLFHWISVVLLVAIAAIGLTMEDLPNSPDKIRVYALHKSLGLTLLGIVVLRLLWRWTRLVPADVPGLSIWVRRAAAAVHWGLYAMMLAMPLTGWILNSAEGFPLQWFKLVNLPAIAPESADLADLAEDLHENGFWLLVALAAGHVLAALYHHFFLGDGTLGRMLPGRRRHPESTP